MNANSFGNLFKITTFGESHGIGLGVVIEGCPSEVSFNKEVLESFLSRRAPGKKFTSPRKEKDKYEIISGIFEGKTLGTPICVIVYNEDVKSEDYKSIRENARIGHADDVWKEKFSHVDYRGGGRSSGRETVSRVIGGAFAKMFLNQIGLKIKVQSFISEMGPLREAYDGESKKSSEERIFLNDELNKKGEELLDSAKESGESYGGAVTLAIKSCPSGLGQPVFKKLKSELTQAYMSVGATCGVYLGADLESFRKSGSNFHQNYKNSVYGGLRGGISTGEDIILQVLFKPTSSIKDIAKKGRHDPCIILRARVVLEAMTYLVLADHVLWNRLDRVKH